jgi:hypothetical protein
MPELVMGGELSQDQLKKTMQAWKYTMPAFVVLFFFVLDPLGAGVLLKLPAGATWLVIGGLLVIAPSDTFDVVGVAIAVAAIVLQVIRGRIAAPA